MVNEFYKQSARVVKDFPKPGVNFLDLSPIFKDSWLLTQTRFLLLENIMDIHPDYVVGIEARGFITATLLACTIAPRPGLILARKKGKLPPPVVSADYVLEYGETSIEIEKDAIPEGSTIVISDDVLATGGTAIAVYNLIKQFKPRKVVFSFLAEISDFEGYQNIVKETGCKVYPALSYTKDQLAELAH